jgi:hypothetical protein
MATRIAKPKLPSRSRIRNERVVRLLAGAAGAKQPPQPESLPGVLPSGFFIPL